MEIYRFALSENFPVGKLLGQGVSILGNFYVVKISYQRTFRVREVHCKKTYVLGDINAG